MQAGPGSSCLHEVRFLLALSVELLLTRSLKRFYQQKLFSSFLSQWLCS